MNKPVSDLKQDSAKLKKVGSNSVERPSLLVGLKIISRDGSPLDESEVWGALVDAFRRHPTMDVYQAEVKPDGAYNG